MPLAVVDGQRKDAKPLGPRDGRGRRRIEPAGKQHDGGRSLSDCD